MRKAFFMLALALGLTLGACDTFGGGTDSDGGDDSDDGGSPQTMVWTSETDFFA